MLDSYLKPSQTRNERATGRSPTIRGGGGCHHGEPARSFVCRRQIQLQLSREFIGWGGAARSTALDGDAGSGEAPGAAVAGEPALLHSEPPNHGEVGLVFRMRGGENRGDDEWDCGTRGAAEWSLEAGTDRDQT